MLLKLAKSFPNARHFLNQTRKQNFYLQPKCLVGIRHGIQTFRLYKNVFKVKLCKESLDDIKDTIVCLAQVLIRQCQVYTSQQLRHSLQHYSFYSRTWGEEVAHRMFSNARRSILNKSKSMLLSAACLLSYNWDQNNISDLKMERAVDEYTTVGDLCSQTVVCEDCRKRYIIDQKVNGVDYCMCRGVAGYTDSSRQYDCWEPFLERENIIVWRKKHEKYPYLYCYKVYGTYEDMSSAAFMEVQLNTVSRTVWDSTALELSVLNSHPETNSDLIYWIVKFPQFFSDRDYVYTRRFKVNEEKKEVVIVSEAANNAPLAQVKNLHRVSEYWSSMVIRANEEFHKPGMSYTLTYFDNPGMSLPAAVTNYVASTGFPRYLQRVYARAMDLQRQWEKGDDVYVTLPHTLRFSRDTTAKSLPSTEEAFTQLATTSVAILEKANEESNLNSNHEVMSHMTISKFIKNLVKVNDKNLETSTEADGKDIKIPFQYKGIILDLLEAIEVISPDPKEKNFLVKLINSLLWERERNSDLDNRTPLWHRVKALRDRVLAAIKASNTEQESLGQIKEHKSKDHYDDYLHDQEAAEMLSRLFTTINEVLQADKDQRTGKGILKQDEKNVSGESDSQMLPQSGQLDVDKGEHCACCDCQHCYSSEKASSLWLPRSFATYFWPTNEKDTPNYEQFCHKCAKEHKSLERQVSSGGWWTFGYDRSSNKENCEGKDERSKSEHSSFAWSFYSPKETESTGPECSFDSHGEPTAEDASLIDAKVVSESWIWYPIQGSLEVVAWLSSLWLSQVI